MKKNIKKIVFQTIIVLAFISFIPINAKTLLQDDLSDDKEYLQRNWDRYYLSTQIQQLMNDYYNIKDLYADEYPNYFGGMYISDDAKNLIIQIVKENIPNESSDEYEIYSNIINKDKSIKIEYVNNTFNELNLVNNNVANLMLENELENNNINGTYIDVMNNKIVVELNENTKTQQQKISRNIFNDISLFTLEKDNLKLITYQKSDKSFTYEDIKAGAQIKVNGGRCSMGFRTRLNGKDGYVTAGHCLEGGGSIETGTIKLVKYANNQKGDYGFVETNSLYTPINKLAYTKDKITQLAVVSYCPTITVNMAVAKSGYKTKYTDGKVKGLNQTVEYTDDDGNVIKTIKGLVKTNVESDHGDSGAVVFIPREDSNGGSVVVDVLSGGNKGKIFGIGRTMYFTDISSMPDEIQLRY